jgi:hypothetical protein
VTIQETLVSVLTGAGLTVYPLSVPTGGSYPNVVYQTISNRQIRSHAGVEMERPRMQISCWAKTYAACVTTAQAVKNALDLNQADFNLATKENEIDIKEVESGLYRTVLDYFIWQGV